MKLTNRFQTVAVVGYRGSVSKDENRAAHGAVCLLQARKNKNGAIIGREINSNGRHQEIGESFELDLDRFNSWTKIK